MASRLFGLVLWVAGVVIATYYSAWAALQLVSKDFFNVFAATALRCKETVQPGRIKSAANVAPSTANARACCRNNSYLLVHHPYREQNCSGKGTEGKS